MHLDLRRLEEGAELSRVSMATERTRSFRLSTMKSCKTWEGRNTTSQKNPGKSSILYYVYRYNNYYC